MTMKLLFSIVAAAGMLALPGCNPADARAKAYQKSLKEATPRLSACGDCKTPGGKPVRMFKVENHLGENLLLVVGDTSAEVSMPNAATLKIGEKTIEQMYLADSSGYVAGVGFSGKEIQVNCRLIDQMKRPAVVEGKATSLEQVVKANINKGVIELPALDAL